MQTAEIPSWSGHMLTLLTHITIEYTGMLTLNTPEKDILDSSSLSNVRSTHQTCTITLLNADYTIHLDKLECLILTLTVLVTRIDALQHFETG